MTAITRRVLSICLTAAWLCSLAAAQSVSSSQTLPPAQASAVVPRLVNYSGKALDAEGKILSGTAGATFSIYSEQSGGAPLWMETQNITADAKGNYTVQLGATKPDGLPLDVFTSGAARWLGVRINSDEEQPRVLLLSVPYALKAADAETVGGLPASAFMLAGAANAAAVQSNIAAPSSSASPATSSDVTTSGGTLNTLPLFTTATNVQSSILTQTGSGATGKIGINTATPASTLDVNGAGTIRGNLSLPATGSATSTAGTNSQPTTLTASAYNSSTKAAVSQNFRWQAEPAANNTAAPSGTLNLLYSSGTGTPAESGLKIAKNGQITFAAGQTFPTVTGNETVTGDLTASELISTVATGTAPLKVTSTTEVANLNASLLGGKAASAFAQLAATNIFTGANDFEGAITNFTGNAYWDVPPNTDAIDATAGGPGYTAVYGLENASSGGSYGVYGATFDQSGAGVKGVNFGQFETQFPIGVSGISAAGWGVYGAAGSVGVYGENTATDGLGVEGVGFFAPSGSGENGGAAVAGEGGDGDAGTFDGNGGDFFGGSGTIFGDGIDVFAGSGYAAEFSGDVTISGTLSKSGGSFKIDHPLDPANKYLYHSFVESPDMKNIYDGVATLDASGEAAIQMPEWFGALNRDFRYQLTCIGGFAPVYIAEKLTNNQFKIGGGKPGMEVSWQITGIRQDAWANAHRIPVEEEKEARLKGFYIHPELYGAPPEKQIEWARHPQMMKRQQETRQMMKAKQARPTQSAALAHRSR